MSSLKIRAALALAVVGTAASAFGSYQWLQPTAARQSPPADTATAKPLGLASQAIAAPSSHLARLKPGMVRELDALGSSGITGAFAHFSAGTPSEQDALIAASGLTVAKDFREFTDAVFVYGNAASLLALARQPTVSYLEQNVKMRYFGETGPWSTRVRVAQETVQDGPYRDAGGAILDGSGIGISVVDSGANAPHPDLVNNIAKNYKIICPTPGLVSTATGLCFGGAVIQDLGKTASSDTTGGHGTHCAGIALGDGSASKGLYPVTAAAPNIQGTFTGAAPKAKLYAYGAGEGLNIFSSSEAFDHILKNNASFTPRIRVVSNSYGVGPDATTGVAAEYDPTDAFSQLTIKLVQSGVSVVFAAGNDGSATATDTTSPTCKDPTPGVVCVASYDDAGTGSTANALSDFTSQGPLNDPTKYPDIAAPGTNITSTCTEPQPGQGVCATGAETRWLPYYGTISGTSMATPHVAGAIALLYQAKPTLTPAEVEVLIQNNARKLADNVYGAARAAYVPDPQNSTGTTNYRAGAGLLDLPTTLKDPKINAAHGTLPAAGVQTLADGDTETGITGAADIVKATVLEEVQGGQSGITYALTLRDATAFGTPAVTQVRLMVNSNVDGKHFNSGAILKADGTVSPLPRGPNANAAATAASKAGNVVSFFVPLGSMGGPAIGAPIHNFMASSFTTGSSGETAADYTPSSSTTASVAAMQPSFGKPYTVLNASQTQPEDLCKAPGITVLTDGAGDVLMDGFAQSNPNAFDIQSLSISQPYFADDSYRINFYLRMAGFSSVPAGSLWPIAFCSPAFPNCTDTNAAISATNKYFTVQMSTFSSPTPVFQILKPSATGTSTTTVTALAGSGYSADGLITIIVNATDIGLTKTGAGSEQLKTFLTRVTDPGFYVDSMPNSALGAGSYNTRPLAFCAPNRLPVAVLESNVGRGAKPLKVMFDGSKSSDVDAGDSVTSYTFDFGDNAAFAVQSTPMVEHTYAKGGSYTAKLKVKDSKGAESTTLGMVTITVDNTAPVAVLTSSADSVVAGSAVTFDATGSSDANSNDAVVSYSFDLDGDGTYELLDSTNAKPSMTYSTAGTYVAKLKVKDREGLESAVVSKTITVTSTTTPPPPANTAPTAQLMADKTSGTAPLTVVFDASSSSDADSGDMVVSYSFDLDGDGNYEIIDSSNAKPSFTYTAAGTYAAKVKVKDKSGTASAAATRTITVMADTPAPAPSGNRPPVAVLAAPGASVAAQSVARFDGISSYDMDGNDGVASLRFDFGDNTPVVTVAAGIVEHRYAAEGNYLVTLVVTDTKGADSAPVTQKVTIAPAVVTPTGDVATGAAVIKPTTPGSGGAASPALLGLLGLAALQRRRRKH